MTTIVQATQAVRDLKGFIGPAQLQVMGSNCRGEEGEFFKAKFVEMAELVSTMPKTYEQEGKGEETMAYLHYFTSGCDWYITERDINFDGEGQLQAFGAANLGYGAELGYISIVEILEAGAELDLYFTPCLLKSIQKAQNQVKVA